jgi:hypothetical protein
MAAYYGLFPYSNTPAKGERRLVSGYASEAARKRSRPTSTLRLWQCDLALQSDPVSHATFLRRFVLARRGNARSHCAMTGFRQSFRYRSVQWPDAGAPGRSHDREDPALYRHRLCSSETDPGGFDRGFRLFIASNLAFGFTISTLARNQMPGDPAGTAHVLRSIRCGDRNLVLPGEGGLKRMYCTGWSFALRAGRSGIGAQPTASATHSNRRCASRAAVRGTAVEPPKSTLMYGPAAGRKWRRCCRKSLICIRPVYRSAGHGLDGNTHAPLILLAERLRGSH